MRGLRRATCSLALAGVLIAAGGVSLPVPAAHAAVGPPDVIPAQYHGYGWGGVPFWPGGFAYFGPDFTSPYAGNPGYPYYRRGGYYSSGYGLPYPVYPSYEAYYGPSYGPSYPFYSSAGGVWFGTSDSGPFPSFGRCFYTAMAGIGGSWYDPPSYGVYAPFC